MLQRSLRAHVTGGRPLWLRTFDSLAWMFALAIAAVGRTDFALGLVSWQRLLIAGAMAVLLHLSFGWLTRLHQGRAALGSLEEMMLLGTVTAMTGGVLFAINLNVDTRLVPRSVPLVAVFVATAIMGWARATWRRREESERKRQRNMANAVPVLILGAGDGGRQLIRSMRLASQSGFTRRATDINWDPVGLLDDDQGKRHLRIDGVPVLGTSHDIASMASLTGAALILVAIPSADAVLIRARLPRRGRGRARRQGPARRR